MLDDENDNLILSQIADALENKYWEINPFEDKHEDILLSQAVDFLEKGTSRQRSGKGAIRKRFPLQKPRWEKTKLTIRYLYHENIS